MRKAFGVLAIFLCGAVLRLPAFTRPVLSDDEAIYASVADALGRGAHLYHDAVDHKPPFIYYLYEAGFALAGPFQTHGAHALALVAVLITGALLWRMRLREAPTVAAAGAVTAALWLLFSTTWHDYDALAANCEIFVLVPQSAAALLLLRGWERRWTGGRFAVGHLMVGVLVGLAALCKYQGVTFLGVGLATLAFRSRAQGLPARRAVLGGLLEIGGAALPLAGYVALAARTADLLDALFWFRFNFAYVGAGLSGGAALLRGLERTLLIGGAALVPYALGLAAAVATAKALLPVFKRGDDGHPRPIAPVDIIGLAWLCSSAIAVSAGGRFFGHYFLLVLPPLCLLAAPRFLARWRRQGRPRRWLLVLCSLSPLAFFLLATVARPVAAALDERDVPYAPVAARIAALTPPDAPIFVWGNSPQLYVLARRPMGTRFSFCNYMTGESPGTPTEHDVGRADRNSLPIAWDMLFADLDERRPTLFVDAAAAGWDGYDKFPLTRYPRLEAYLAQHYQRIEQVEGVALYRRRD